MTAVARRARPLATSPTQSADSPQPPDLDTLCKIAAHHVASAYQLTAEDLCNFARRGRRAEPRAVLAYILRDVLYLTHPEISNVMHGDSIGARPTCSHATAFDAVKRGRRLIREGGTQSLACELATSFRTRWQTTSDRLRVLHGRNEPE